MYKNKKFIFIALLLFFCINIRAQDPQFTQFYANPLYLNPAFAGSNRCPRVIFNFRDQWPGIGATYVTYSASYDQHFDALSGGVGLLVYNDRAGENTIQTTSANLIYSYHLPVNRFFSIRAGFQASFFQKTLDWRKLTFGDMIDERYGFIYATKEQQPSQSVIYPDFSAGIIGYSKKFYAGFAAHHLTQPNEAFIVNNNESRLPLKFTAHIGAMIPLQERLRYGNDETSISPNLLIKKQADFFQVNFGIYLKRGVFVIGAWYRNQDSFILLVGLQQDNFRFGYSYDVTVSKLSMKTAGSHEISMALLFDCRPKRRRFRTISCPSF